MNRQIRRRDLLRGAAAAFASVGLGIPVAPPQLGQTFHTGGIVEPTGRLVPEPPCCFLPQKALDALAEDARWRIRQQLAMVDVVFGAAEDALVLVGQRNYIGAGVIGLLADLELRNLAAQAPPSVLKRRIK